MSDLQQLIRQMADLERQIAQLNSKGRQEAIDEIRRIMSEHQRRQDDNAVLYAGGRRPGGTGMSSNAHRSGAAEICRRSWRR